MGDVTDRQAVRARTGLPVREHSNVGQSSGSSGGCVAELKEALSQVEPLPGSQNLSSKEVDAIIQTTAKFVGDTSHDWTKRLNMLKTFRSLCADSTHLGQVNAQLRYLMVPLQGAVKDLRSQLGREACLTVAFLTAQLGVKADCFVEPMLPTLFSLLVANAKVVSLTGAATISLIYEYVPSFRILPPLQTQMASKSKDVRRAVCSILNVIFSTWPTAQMAKHAQLLADVTKRGLTDADADARNSTREAFPAFQATFPQFANGILDTLDPVQRRQLQSSMANPPQRPQQIKPQIAPRSISIPKTNGSASAVPPPLSQQTPQQTPTSSYTTGSLTRQGSLIKKTSIPVLASRISPAKPSPAAQPRSASAIDIQAVNRAKQQHNFSTLRSPVKAMVRTNSAITPPSSSRISPQKYSVPFNFTSSFQPSPSTPGSGTLDRARNSVRQSRVSHSQPGSRSNSPSSRYAYATYSSPYAQHSSGSESLSFTSPPPRLGRRISNSSASSSRDTSPQGRILLNTKPRRSSSSSANSTPQAHIMIHNPNSITAKMLMESREAEVQWGDAIRSRRDFSELDGGGNHSDSEDSLSSHRSFRSETFSPPSTTRHFFPEDNVEELLTKCGSAKWSERKEGLIGLQSYLNRHGALPTQCLNRIGQLFCRIFMDAHTKVLSLFLDVLHSVLNRHAKDLVDFTTILLNRILTKLGSDLLTSVQTKLLKTLEIITEEMPADLQFSAVTHYLCDPTQTPNSRSRVAALQHLYSLSSIPVPVKPQELQLLADKLLDWSGDMRSHEVRRTAQKVFTALFDMATPQMTLVMGKLSPAKQDQAKSIIRTHPNLQQQTPVNQQPPANQQEWSSLKSDILSLAQSAPDSDLVVILSRMTLATPPERSYVIADLLVALKEAPDARLLENHKEVLKVLFNVLGDASVKPVDKCIAFCCLEELCSRQSLSQTLAAFTELFIVRVTDVQTAQMPREVSKAAENCGMALAVNFPPEVIARAICPIVNNKDVPVNQLAIKMLQRLCDTCSLAKLRSLSPDIISTLISAYDHPDSAVRKAAVFAIVALHSRLGAEELRPHLSVLNGSKLKLLELYITRAEQQNQQAQEPNA